MEAADKPLESQRLQRLAQPHAGSFVTALASRHDGFDTILKPRTFRTAGAVIFTARMFSTDDFKLVSNATACSFH